MRSAQHIDTDKQRLVESDVEKQAKQTCSLGLPPAQTRQGPRLHQHWKADEKLPTSPARLVPGLPVHRLSLAEQAEPSWPPAHRCLPSRPAARGWLLFLGSLDLVNSASQEGWRSYGLAVHTRLVTALCQKAKLIFGCGLVFTCEDFHTWVHQGN